jgi:signal transduction histidine kinase
MRRELFGSSDVEMHQIVHDLKNPLATMMLELCLLEAKSLAPDVRARIHHISKNVAFLDRLVQEILDGGALEADMLRVHRRPIELRGLLESIIERSLASRDRIRVFLDASYTVTVEADELRIERVVCNLLNNALKYSASSTGVLVRLDRRDRYARVSVVDAGPGLTDRDKRVVFEKYTRTRASLSREGHGLGLYISRRIVEEHGGTIGVDSVPGVGSRFFFELPIENT